MRGGVYRSFVELEEATRRSYPIINADTRLIAFLFMRVGQYITDKMIVPSLRYFDLLSGEHIDFIVAGWSKVEVGRGSHCEIDWIYDEDNFVRACDAIEGRTNWSYSGGTDLLLCTTVPDHSKTTTIDLNAVISISLDKLRDGKIDSPEIVLKRVIDFAKSYRGPIPLQALSLQEARVSLFEAVVDTVLGFISKEAKEKAAYAKQFLVKDVQKEGHWNRVTCQQHELGFIQDRHSAKAIVYKSALAQVITTNNISVRLPQPPNTGG